MLSTDLYLFFLFLALLKLYVWGCYNLSYLFPYLEVKSLLLLFSWFYIQYTYPGYNRTCQHHVGRAPSTWGDSCTWLIMNQLYFTSMLVIITSSGYIDQLYSVCSLQIEWIYIIYLPYRLEIYCRCLYNRKYPKTGEVKG